MGEYTTIGGLLCSLHGRIPRSGTKITFANYVFTILKVEDHRRVHEILAEPVKDRPAAASAEVGSSVLPKAPRRNASSSSSAVSSPAVLDLAGEKEGVDFMSAQEDDFSTPGGNGTTYSGDEGDLDVSASIVSGLEEAESTVNGNESDKVAGTDSAGIPVSGVSFIDGEWVESNGKSV